MITMFKQILPDDGENRNYVAFMTMCTCQQHDFSLITFKVENGQRVCKYCIEIDDIVTWLQKPPKFIKKESRGIVFDNYCLQDQDGIINYDLRQKMISLLLIHQIPFRFLPNEIFNCISMLIGANVNLKIDETLLQVFVHKSEIKTFELKRCDFGYFLAEKKTIPIKDGESKDEIKNKILDKTNPKQILATWMECSGNGLMKDVRAALKSKKLTVLGIHVNGFTFETSFEILKHLYNNDENKFHIRSPYSDTFGITEFAEASSTDDLIFSTEGQKGLPFTESKIVTRFTKMFYKTVQDNATKELFCFDDPYIVPEECHKIKFTLSVDANTYPTITHEAIILPEVTELPQKLNPEQTTKIPIIGFFDNSSVICLWNEENNCYEFSESWNGMFGKDLFLDFIEEKPTFVDRAEDVNALVGAVYDLIKIMSFPPDNIKHEHHWGFQIAKDAENPILIEFETHEGYPQAASPAFLMKMMLREHIRAIKKETDANPTKIGFCLLDNFNEEEKKRVETGLEEACKLLKMDFVMVEDK